MRNVLLCKNFRLSVFSVFVAAVLCVNSPSNKSVSCLTVGNRRFSLSCIQLALNPILSWSREGEESSLNEKWEKNSMNVKLMMFRWKHTHTRRLWFCCKHKDVLRDDKSKRRLNRTMAHKRAGRHISVDAKVLALRMVSMAVDASAGVVHRALHPQPRRTPIYGLLNLCNAQHRTPAVAKPVCVRRSK